ncbi:hypothetical protein [Pandoraea sputorum]|uniref:hypothetical protein n=1 Tax=Pandoraea sputorum TaxID=93222 RepID=UPI00123F8283|nr:hypothetical protein [Pandoraea sputorum]VVE79917.1 hypothetical protein PSP31120_02476 [Pandoraea sputorum]
MGPLQRIGRLLFADRKSQRQADRPNIDIIGALPTRIRRAVRNNVVHVSHADREKAGQQCSGDVVTGYERSPIEYLVTSGYSMGLGSTWQDAMYTYVSTRDSTIATEYQTNKGWEAA